MASEPLISPTSIVTHSLAHKNLLSILTTLSPLDCRLHEGGNHVCLRHRLVPRTLCLALNPCCALCTWSPIPLSLLTGHLQKKFALFNPCIPTLRSYHTKSPYPHQPAFTILYQDLKSTLLVEKRALLCRQPGLMHPSQPPFPGASWGSSCVSQTCPPHQLASQACLGVCLPLLNPV